MRPRQYTITRRTVHVYAEHVCQRHIRLQAHGRQCKASILWALLFWAAARLSSLAAACRALRDAPSNTAARDALLATLPDIAELQRRLNRALQGDLPRVLRQRRQPLAIDLKLVPYHGQPLHDPAEVYRSQARGGTSHFHAYATAYVTRKSQRFSVALVRVTKGQPLPEVVRALLRQAARAGVRPRYLLLDRGFCSVAVIRYLQRARYPFLMPLVLRGRQADHPKGPSASRVFACWKKSGWGRYTLTSGTKERAQSASVSSAATGAASAVGTGAKRWSTLTGADWCPARTSGSRTPTASGSGSKPATDRWSRPGFGRVRATRCCACCTWGRP